MERTRNLLGSIARMKSKMWRKGRAEIESQDLYNIILQCDDRGGESGVQVANRVCFPRFGDDLIR